MNDPLWLWLLPRFFEVITVTEMRNITTEGNTTLLQEVVTYDITDLRMDPMYIRCNLFPPKIDWARCFRFYINWTRLVFTCMLPVLFLILLNYKIFRGIRFSKLLLRSIFIMRCHFFCILRVLEVFEDFHHDMVVFFNSEHERASSAIILLPSALCFHFPRRWYVEKLRRYVKKLLQNILFFSSWKDIAAQRNPKHLGRKKSSNI